MKQEANRPAVDWLQHDRNKEQQGECPESCLYMRECGKGGMKEQVFLEEYTLTWFFIMPSDKVE